MADANVPVPEAPKEARKPRSLARELPVLVAVALVLALIIKTFLVQAFFIPSESMQNTLLVGDRVMVNKVAMKLGGHVHRGEIVVFRDPGGWLGEVPPSSGGNALTNLFRDVFQFFGLMPSADQGDLIKRVIGVGGDHVKCCTSDGKVTVNGKALDEPYLYPGDPSSTVPFDVTVPKGRLWVMGDHRSVSRDSSRHLNDPGGGTIPEDRVVGRAFVRMWPLSRMSGLGVPKTFHGLALDGPLGPVPAGSEPAVLGFVAAVPVTLLRRRRKLRAAAAR